MSRYIDADNLPRHGNRGGVVYWRDIEAQPTADVVEVEKVNKIYEKLADLFGIPCNYSPCDEIMLESERCMEDCGNIPDAECWRRYFEIVCNGERKEA